MANVFVEIEAPQGTNVGASVDLAAMVGPRTLLVAGSFGGSLQVEISEDDIHFVPAARAITRPATVMLDYLARRVRISSRGVTGDPVAFIGGVTGTTGELALPLPASANGVGAEVFTSGVGAPFTAVVAAAAPYRGSLMLEGRHPGGEWVELLSFPAPDVKLCDVAVASMRVRSRGFHANGVTTVNARGVGGGVDAGFLLLHSGGELAGVDVQGKASVYDSVANQWRDLLGSNNYNGSIGQLVAFPDDGGPYSVGGATFGTVRIDGQQFDVNAEEWVNIFPVLLATGQDGAHNALVPASLHPSGKSKGYLIGGSPSLGTHTTYRKTNYEVDQTGIISYANLAALPVGIGWGWCDYTPGACNPPGLKLVILGAHQDNTEPATACDAQGRDLVWVYDIANDAWSNGPPVAAGTFPSDPAGCGFAEVTAVVLDSGAILTVGGRLGTGGGAVVADCLLLDNNVWIATGAMAVARVRHGAIVLQDGRVLAFGGDELGTAEIWDPDTEVWTAVASMNEPRDWPVTCLMPDGRVMVAGGRIRDSGDPSFTAEVYDPVADTWTYTVAGGYADAPALAFRGARVSGNFVNHMGSRSNWYIGRIA